MAYAVYPIVPDVCMVVLFTSCQVLVILQNRSNKSVEKMFREAQEDVFVSCLVCKIKMFNLLSLNEERNQNIFRIQGAKISLFVLRNYSE